jgi:hypothetical protein
VLFVVLLAASTAHAQEREFGAKAGPSFSTLTFEPEESGGYDRRISADGGGFLVLPLTPRFAVQLEALFTSRGAKLLDDETGTTGAILLQYLDFPALIRIKGPSWASRSLHLFGGPYAGIRLAATREVSFYANSIRTGNKSSISSEIERFEFGLTAGAGVDFGRRIVVDGRYCHGISALNTDKSDGFRIRNRGVSIMAGVRF